MCDFRRHIGKKHIGEVNWAKVGMSNGSPADIYLPSNPFTQTLKERTCPPIRRPFGPTICSDNTLASIGEKNWVLLWEFDVFDLTAITTPTIIKTENPFYPFQTETHSRIYSDVLFGPQSLCQRKCSTTIHNSELASSRLNQLGWMPDTTPRQH